MTITVTLKPEENTNGTANILRSTTNSLESLQEILGTSGDFPPSLALSMSIIINSLTTS